MKYFWVNQNKTGNEEIGKGFMWAPEYGKANRRLRPYELMKMLPKDAIVFSYCNAHIMAIGKVLENASRSDNPFLYNNEWEKSGYRAPVAYEIIKNPISPKDHKEKLQHFSYMKYSPLNCHCGVNQSYLFEISEEFAEVLCQIIGGVTLKYAPSQNK